MDVLDFRASLMVQKNGGDLFEDHVEAAWNGLAPSGRHSVFLDIGPRWLGEAIRPNEACEKPWKDLPTKVRSELFESIKKKAKGWDVFEQLQAVFLGVMSAPKAALQRVITAVDSMVDNPELDGLEPTELRGFQGFRITAHRAASMTDDMMMKHVLAHWPAAKQAVLKLSIGPEVERAVGEMYVV